MDSNTVFCVILFLLCVLIFGLVWMILLLVREMRLTKALTLNTPAAYMQSRQAQTPVPPPPSAGKPPERPMTPGHRRVFSSVEFDELKNRDNKP